MIVVRTKAGVAWTVLSYDRLEVTTPEGRRTGFRVDDIAEVIVDARGGAVAILDGASPRNGLELRGIQVTDAETDVPVRMLFPLEDALALSGKLREGKLWTPPSIRP